MAHGPAVLLTHCTAYTATFFTAKQSAHGLSQPATVLSTDPAADRAAHHGAQRATVCPAHRRAHFTALDATFRTANTATNGTAYFSTIA